MGLHPISTSALQGKDPRARLRYLKLVHHLADPAALLPDDVPVKVKGHLHFNGDRNQCLQGRRLKLGLGTRAERHHGQRQAVGGTRESRVRTRALPEPSTLFPPGGGGRLQLHEVQGQLEESAPRRTLANAQAPASAPDRSRPLADAQRRRTGRTRDRDVGRGGREAAGRQRLAPASPRSGTGYRPSP